MILSRSPQLFRLTSEWVSTSSSDASEQACIVESGKPPKTSPCVSWTRKARVRVEEGHDESSCSLKFKCNLAVAVLSIVLPSSMFFTLLHFPPKGERPVDLGKASAAQRAVTVSSSSALFVATEFYICIIIAIIFQHFLKVLIPTSAIFTSPFNFCKHGNTLHFPKHVQLSGCLTVAS